MPVSPIPFAESTVRHITVVGLVAWGNNTAQIQ